MTQQHSIKPPAELVREWQREANHNEPMFPQVAAKAAKWGADQVAAPLSMSNQEKTEQINKRIGLRADGRISVWCAGAWETSRLLAGLLFRIEDLERHYLDKQDQSILEEDRSSNFPSENCVSTDYHSLCIRLLNALDSGNAKAEEHVLCQIRQAIKEETP